MKTNFTTVEMLLVEDNASDAEFTLRALQKPGLANKVFVAKDGAEALEFIFATGRYAERGGLPLKVIFLDLKLPKVNGLEILKQVKSDERTRMIPIVLLTSSHEPSDIQEGYRLGVNSFVVKPIEFDAFDEAIQQAALYWLVLNKPPHP